MTDEEILAAEIERRERDVHFLTSACKTERERWVAREFLLNLECEFSEEELVPSPQEPPDVIFRSSHFEIKEIVDDDCRRHEEAKKELEIALRARKPEDLVQHREAHDILYKELVQLIEERTIQLANEKYVTASTREKLDLLFYAYPGKSRAFVSEPLPSLKAIASCGFRSVSLLMGNNSIVLVASSQAAEIIRSRAKLVF
jgi:hypothetical protein